ncbi:MAG: tRNA lysidine(34) synthetase TilS [Sphingomonadaceae bacterium]|nr:tRNA lysidine(34) synthetase TilS [Sphingomonadaceae bacterium]
MPRAKDFPARDDGLVPQDALTRQFTEGLSQLWPEGQANDSAKLGLAVSGGPDSCALLLLASAALPGRVEAATVDHGLRRESAEEAEFVSRLCGRLGVVHQTCAVEVAKGNVQSQARAARYAALAQWAEDRQLTAIATAHHADDQAETLLLRLNRASGVAGLAGTRARGKVPDTQLPVLRPLLDWRRSDLAEIVEQAAVIAVQDPSNLDDRFDRVRLRKALASSPWLHLEAIAQSASHLADADSALDWAMRREWEECVRKEGLGLTYRPKAPRAIALRVISRIVREMDGEEPRGGSVARVFDAMLAGKSVSIGDMVARPGPEGWSFAKAPKRRQK